MEAAALGLRDIILLCIGIAGVYLVVTILQLSQLRRRILTETDAIEPSVASRLPIEKGSPKPRDYSFASQLERSQTESELIKLNRKLERMQLELEATQNEVKRLRDERDTTNKVPMYSEAIVLANRGLDASQIAARCNISKSEAELVTALARKGESVSLSTGETTKSMEPKENNERTTFRAAA